MAKDPFTEEFQKCLKTAITNKLLRQKWFDYQVDDLHVLAEYQCTSNAFTGFIDICIKNRDYETAIIAIEIEHKSSFDQSWRNIQKMRE